MTEKARECYSRSGELDSADRALLLYRKFTCLLRLGRHKEAYSILEEALLLDYPLHTEIFDYDPDLK